jgi:hypothetical protein
MALLTAFRAIWTRKVQPRTRRRRRLALEFLEGREVPSVGGGFTAGGISGQYFDNPNFSGSPAFTRQDVRIDFDWQLSAPGGSNSPDFKRVGADNFSVRWAGQLIPRFTETYTFRTTSDDGVRLWIRPTGSSSWIQLVNDWGPHGAMDDTGSFALVAGQTYDIRMDYYELSGAAVARLAWSSPSTPEEVIDPATNIGVNAVTYDSQVYADVTKASRNEWGDPVDYFGKPLVPTDWAGWPTRDAAHIFWEGQDPSKTAGTYQLRFSGKADVTAAAGKALFQANGIMYGGKLPSGAGYDPGSNTTVANVIISNADLFQLSFRNTQRDAGSPTNTGITNVQLLRPIAPGSNVDYRPTDLFTNDVKTAFSRFTTLRYLTANFNGESEWWQRKLPGQMVAAWGDRDAVWEYEVMLANETGKDLYITIPMNASADYVQKLAQLLRYGSDGVNPYTGPTANPVYPGLDPNLRVYVEWANETWNWAFSQSSMGVNASQAAVQNNTPEGQIINYDGQRPNGDFRRWTALKTVEASNTFRSVWGDGAMGGQVRMVLEYQYDNIQDTAMEELRFIDNYFNNADGKQHVSNPNPVSYYLWGAGGASYFGASNPRGLVSDIAVPDGSFEWAPVANGSAEQRAVGSAWQFTSSAGVLRNVPGVAPNQAMWVNGIGSVPATPAGNQALFVSGSGTASVTINFPRAGIYAIDFTAAAELGNNQGNPLDFYFDGQRVTPNAQSLTPNLNPWTPGTGFGRDPSTYTVYGTVPVVVSGPGQHTFKIVGRGNSGQTTVLDDLHVSSTDAIFASQIPGGGQAAGQVSSTDYQAQMIAQAKYALAYGLKVVAYEGGWSLGGDTQSVPIESYAKYRDSRATNVMGQAIDAFYRAGGELDVLGTYDQWYVDDAANAGNYPLVQAIDSRNNSLPVAATAGFVVPGTLSVAARAADVIQGHNDSGFVQQGEWISWNVLVPSTGDYRVSAQTTPGGQVGIFVDDDPLIDGATGSSIGDVSRLTPGVHSIRVQSESGGFFIQSITISQVGAPASAPPPPVVNPPVQSTASGLPAGFQSDDVGAPALSGSAHMDGNTFVVSGAGQNIWGSSDEFQYVHKYVNGDVVMTTRVDSMDPTHAWAKAGFMVRSGLGESAPFAAVYNTPGNGVMFEWRSYYRGAPQSVTVNVPPGPVWVKLVRRGNSFAAYYSQDGQTWNRIGTAQTVVMPGAVQAGMVVTSHDPTRTATARFSNVTMA